MFVGASFSHFCYINHFLQPCNVSIAPDSNLATVQFLGPIGPADRISVALLGFRSLKPSETLNIFYNYYEYKGITNKLNFGITANSYIDSKILYQDRDLRITTNGTGAINTADLLSKDYEPLIPKLPKIDSVDDGDFTGTIHTRRNIKGGSYSAVAYSSSYVAGLDNYMTNFNVTQQRGTFKGGRFTVVGETGDTGVHKLVVAPLIEMVTDDGTGNFIPGEIALKIETGYLNSTSVNKITNFDSGDITNSYDMFKIIGRPLLKLH